MDSIKKGTIMCVVAMAEYMGTRENARLTDEDFAAIAEASGLTVSCVVDCHVHLLKAVREIAVCLLREKV